MNPSTSGWIKKMFSFIKNTAPVFNDYNELYFKLRANGFIYGVTQSIPDYIVHEHQYSQDEIIKMNLLDALYHVYWFHTKTMDFEHFVNTLLAFYKKMAVADLSIWDKLLIGKNNFSTLERVIHSRIFVDKNIITKNFNKATTSTLLFIDILGFQRYLSTPNQINTYVASIETMVVNITYDSLSFKNKTVVSDKGVLKKIKESVAFIKSNRKDFSLFYRSAIETDFCFEEKKYFLDVACLTVWEDLFTSDYEYNFITSIGADMNLSEGNINDSLHHMAHFYAKNKKLFHLLKTSDPLSNFYFNSTQLVSKLIKRNSKRIIKELTQSKELMILLTQATTRELTKKEQTKVQLQLLDMFKTIPSLAIFILPGGAILLPIVVKLIPNMLPSAFDDNKIDNV